MMNHPAVLNGTRTSPLDKGNLNRAFPGSPTGSLTQRIADYFTRYLVPLCDLALDIHSGGRTLDLLPFAATHRLADADLALRVSIAGECHRSAAKDRRFSTPSLATACVGSSSSARSRHRSASRCLPRTRWRKLPRAAASSADVGTARQAPA